MTKFEKLGISAWSLFAMAMLAYFIVSLMSCCRMEAENLHLRNMKAIENKINPVTLEPEQSDE